MGCSRDAPCGPVRVDDSVGLVKVMNLVSLLDEAVTLVVVRSLFRWLSCEVSHLPLKFVASGSNLPALTLPLWPWQRLEPETRRIVDAYWVALHHKRVGN